MPRQSSTFRRPVGASLGPVLLAVLIGWSVGAMAQVYTWIDEDGVVHYSDVPEGTSVELLDIQSRPTDPARVAAEVERERENFYTDQSLSQQRREEASEQAAADADIAAQRAENCRIAQQRLETYMTAHRLYRPLPNGDREYLTEDEYGEARAKARRDVEEWCD